MLKQSQKFGNYSVAKIAAQKVANELESNVPIYFKGKYYYLWDGDELIEWVKPVIENDDGY